MPLPSAPPARPVRSTRLARSSRAKPLPAAPSSKVSFENYLVVIPAVPVHGTTTAPVGRLLDWRSEIVAVQTEYLYADAALTAANVAKEAVNVAARIAEARHDEAGKHCHLAWSTYTGLVGNVCAETLAPSVGSGSAGKGKGRARASSRLSGGEDEIIDLEELDLGSGVEDGDVEMR